MFTFPNIIEKTGRSEKVLDLPSKLLQNRIIFLGNEVNEFSSGSIVLQLLWLNAQDPKADINLYINSPGGSVVDGLAIYDTIKAIPNKVNTMVFGQASSMGAFLLSAGTGVRGATPNSRIMIHSVSGGFGGTVQDSLVSYKEMEKLQDILMNKIVEHSNGKLNREILDTKSSRDWFMDPDEAIEYGIIDSIITRI
jgi:ATP-dependent Clp protease protease subunit